MSDKKQKKPVAPYLALGLSTVITGIASRKHIKHNLENIEEAIHASVSMTNINMPVKVIALAEGALTGFTDEIFDLPHTLVAKEFFIDIPGEETEWLGRLAKLYKTYIIVQCKARWPEVMDDRFFNTLFVIDPRGRWYIKRLKIISGVGSVPVCPMTFTIAGLNFSVMILMPFIPF